MKKRMHVSSRRTVVPGMRVRMMTEQRGAFLGLLYSFFSQLVYFWGEALKVEDLLPH